MSEPRVEQTFLGGLSVSPGGWAPSSRHLFQMVPEHSFFLPSRVHNKCSTLSNKHAPHGPQSFSLEAEADCSSSLPGANE